VSSPLRIHLVSGSTTPTLAAIAVGLTLLLAPAPRGGSAAVHTGAAWAGTAPADSGRVLSPDPLAFVSPSRPVHTEHIQLELDLDLQQQTIAGSVTHTMISLRDDLTEVALNCVGLTVDAVSVNDQPATYDYPVPGEQTTSWFQTQPVTDAADRLVIHTPAPMARGDRFTVTVRYHGAPREGLYWIQPEKGLPEKRYEVWSQGEGEDNRYWIPCIDYPNDRASFEGSFRVKEGYYVLSNGALVDTRTENGKTTYTWRLEEPIVTYLISVAAAKYEVAEDTDGRVPLLFVVPPGTDRATVDRGYGRTRDMLDFYEKETGIDYPWEKYAQVSVQNFTWGGMENATATTMNMRTLHDARGELTRTNDWLVAHELAHQWWGDMVTCREWSHMWLNEGFATYYQALYREYREGEGPFRYDLWENAQRTIALDKRDPRPLVTDFYNRKDARNSNNVYNKGAALLHMMRYLLGDDGYRAVIRHYGETFKFRTAETQDLMRAVKDVTGQNLDWLFEEWAFLAGHPVYHVTRSWDRDAKLLHLVVKQTQEVGDLVPVFRMPVDVEVTCDEKTSVFRILVDRAEQEFYFDLPSEPRMVIFDKGDWILKELDFPRPTGELVYQLEHGDYISRVRAAVALGKADDRPVAVAALREAVLADGHYGLRRESALALGKLGTTEARDALIEGAKVEDARTRMAVAEALGSFRKDAAAEAVLLPFLREDPGYGVREQAVAALVAMDSPRAGAACREALKQESDMGIVRNAGLNGLVKLDDTEALPLIRKYAGPGNDRSYRHTAITAYASLAKELPREGDRRKAADFLAGMLDDWYLRTRREVIAALGNLGESAAVPALRQQAARDPIEALRTQARKTADTLESGPPASTDAKGVEAEVRDLQESIQGLQQQVEEMRRKLPEKEQEGGTSPK